jgi:hypothetical protein
MPHIVVAFLVYMRFYVGGKHTIYLDPQLKQSNLKTGFEAAPGIN